MDNAELPRPTVGEESQQKNFNLFLRAHLAHTGHLRRQLKIGLDMTKIDMMVAEQV